MAVAPINASASGDTAVVAAVTSPGNKKIRVHSLTVINQVATANNVKFRSGTTDLHAAIPLPLAIGFPVMLEGQPEAQEDFLFETVAGQALNINLSAATAVTGAVVYSLE
jgi:hypothetical protein